MRHILLSSSLAVSTTLIGADGAAADNAWSFRLLGEIPVMCIGETVSAPAPGAHELLLRHECNTPHAVRVSAPAENSWSGTVSYRGATVSLNAGATATFVFNSVEYGVFPVSIVSASATSPKDIRVEIAPL
jgi:hypothetical protein